MAKKRANQPGYVQKVGANGRKYWARDPSFTGSIEDLKKWGVSYPTLHRDAYSTTGTIYASMEAIEEDLVGHSIVAVEGDTLVLGNGQRYVMQDYQDWSAYGSVDVNSFTENNNIITDVIYNYEDDDEDDFSSGFDSGSHSATLHLLANSEPVVDIDLSWDASNGYYAFGIQIEVVGEPDN